MARRGGRRGKIDLELWIIEMPEWKKRILYALARGEKLTARRAVEVAGGEVLYNAIYRWLRDLEAKGVIDSERIGFTRKRVWILKEEYRKPILEAMMKIENKKNPNA